MGLHAERCVWGPADMAFQEKTGYTCRRAHDETGYVWRAVYRCQGHDVGSHEAREGDRRAWFPGQVCGEQCSLSSLAFMKLAREITSRRQMLLVTACSPTSSR